MTETRPAPQRSDPDEAALAANRTRSRKFKAILAGGLVLGVGAAITLAAWNDSEFATGTFTAGSFNLEGSTTGAAAGYDDHNTDDGDAAAALVFTTPFDNLAPEDVVYAPFWLRLAAGTTTDATLVLESITTTDSAEANADDLSYDVYQLASAAATCDAAGIGGGTVVGSGDDLATDAAVTSTTLDLANGADAATAGAPIQLCVVVTAGADLTEAGVTTSTWQFTATSTE